MACILIPWFTNRYEVGADWRALAFWIHNNLPYSELQFFPKLSAFNIGWHENPKRSIYSYFKPAGYRFRGEPADLALAEHYIGFPELRRDTDDYPSIAPSSNTSSA
ncbi:hypothetical protein AB4Z27_26075 [Cupriavidus sp. KB_39]|uniref:hypothetical protein n=1 Tax=Cupriavidus sp. KB_39 TaxID=3233036 RepID=UPI003F930DEE